MRYAASLAPPISLLHRSMQRLQTLNFPTAAAAAREQAKFST